MTKTLEKKLIVTTNFRELSQDAKLDKMLAMANAMASHTADFPSPSPTPAEMLTQINLLRQLREQIRTLQEQQRALVQSYRQHEAELIDSFVDQWAPYVQQQADGDPSKVLEVGFGVKGQSESRQMHSQQANTSDSYPIMHDVDTNVRLQHTLYFVNSITTKKAKPKDADRIEIYEKIGGPAPVDINEMTYLGASSKPSFINHFEAAEAGQTVYYAFRYIDTRNQPGPQSPIQSAIITG